MIYIIGNDIKIFDKLDSTNNFVKQNYTNLTHGSVVVAKLQSDGRGRRDNTWTSELGNLYFSILFKDDIDRLNIFKHIVYSSISVIRLLKIHYIDAKIKYPNDCLADNKKITGILIESSGSSILDYVIVGIGININQDSFIKSDFTATSFKMILGKDFLINDILNEYLDIYNKILKMDYEVLFKEYLDCSIVINKHINYLGEKYLIKSIEKDGSIVIRNKSSERRVAYSKISLKELY